MKASIQIDRRTLERDLKRETSLKIIEAAKKAVTIINAPIKSICLDALTNSPFFKSALNGTLAGELGLPEFDRYDMLHQLVQDIVDTLEVKLRVYNNYRDICSITIEMQRISYHNLLSQNYATVTTDENQILEWLRWVLFEGDNIIIYGYDVKLESGKGRSGIGIMVENYGSGDFRIPAAYSGTQYDNWITRAIDTPVVKDKITDLVDITFTNLLK